MKFYFDKKISKVIAIPVFIMILTIIGIAVKNIFIIDSYFETSSMTTAFFLIFFSVFLLIITIAVLPYLIKKKPITEEKFIEELEAKGYNLSDITNEFSEYNYITKVYLATNKEFKIQFYLLEDEEQAKMFYRNTEVSIENSKADSISRTSSKCTVLSISGFKAISRISNTVICLQVPKFNVKEAKQILKEIGY